MLALVAMRRRKNSAASGITPAYRPALLAAGITLVYTLYIVRVGGDFMFARMLIPVSPFLLILLEAGLLATFRSRPLVG